MENNDLCLSETKPQSQSKKVLQIREFIRWLLMRRLIEDSCLKKGSAFQIDEKVAVSTLHKKVKIEWELERWKRKGGSG